MSADSFDAYLRTNALTRRQAAQALNVPLNTVLSIATGHRVPSPALAARIEAWTGGEVPVGSWPRLATGKHTKPRLALAQRTVQTAFSEWLDRHGVSRAAAAAYLDVSLTTMHRWCRGDSPPPPAKVQEIVEWTRGEITAEVWSAESRAARQIEARTGMMVYGPK